MTATQDQPAQSASSHEPTPAPLDPENEIDAKSATWWFIGGTIVLFLTLWIMLPIFVRVQEQERIKKVDSTPNTELQQAHDAQMQFLAGDNPKNKSLEQAMAEALRK